MKLSMLLSSKRFSISKILDFHLLLWVIYRKLLTKRKLLKIQCFGIDQTQMFWIDLDSFQLQLLEVFTPNVKDHES